MDFVLAILKHSQPTAWDERSYDGLRYVRIELEKDSLEYDSIKSALMEERYGFKSSLILKIERIQHPTAFLGFLLQQKQLEKLNRSVITGREYLKISEGDVPNMLEFNCDSRRGSILPLSHYYHLLEMSSGGFLLVVKTLGHWTSSLEDTYRYPEYLIQYGNKSDVSGSSASSSLSHLLDRLQL